MKMYAYTGERPLLKKLGYQLYRHEGLSYSKPNYYHSGAIYMRANHNMILMFGKLDYDKTFEVVDFIIKNKNKPKSFWYDKEAKKYNYVVTQNGDFIKKDDLKEKVYQELLLEVPEDAARKMSDSFYGQEISVHLSTEFIKNVIELDNLHPLEVV